MPKYWYTLIKPKDGEELSEEDEFNNSICVDKKPYFMKYIYPDLDSKYKTFKKNAERNCKATFGMSIESLMRLQELTDEQASWISWYYRMYPVSDNGSTMNRLCHIVEDEFDGFKTNVKAENNFNYSIMKSNTRYDPYDMKKLIELQTEYGVKAAEICKLKKNDNITNNEYVSSFEILIDTFKRKASELIPNSKMLCDMMLDLCYHSDKTKTFVWNVCGDQIIENLLNKNGRELKYITRDDDGDIEYDGLRFSERVLVIADTE